MRCVRCKAFIEIGRCRRKAAWRRALCPAHQRAHDEAAKAKEELLDTAIELVTVMSEPNAGRVLYQDEADLLAQLTIINERYQSALVASGSFGGVDPDAEVANG